VTQTAPSRSRLPAVLRFREFRLLVSGQAVSRIGNGIYEATLGLMVFSAGSAMTMSVVLIAFIAPQLLLTVKAGVLSDQIDRRRLLITADLLAATMAGIVALIAGTGHLAAAALVVLSLGIGTAAAIFNPAYGPLLSHTVPTDQLAQANGLDAAVTNGANLAAPALGGWLYAAGGAAWALGANSLSFLTAAACSALLRIPTATQSSPIPDDSAGTIDPGAAAAWRYLRSSRWLPPMLILALVMNLLVLGPFFVMLPWRVTSQHLPTITLGLAVSIQAGAALILSLLTSRRPPTRPGRRFAAMTLAFPVALLTLLLCPGSVGVLVAAALVGAGMAAGVMENLMLQSWVPDQLRGRVYAFDVLVSLCAIPVGYLLAGLAIEAGAAWTLGTAGALACVAAATLALTTPLARHPLTQATAVADTA